MRPTEAPHRDNIALERLFAEILLDIPYVVAQACRSLGRHPSQMDFEDVVQQVILLLIDDDYYNLRSFKRLSSPRTWLFSVVRRYLIRQIRRQNRETSLIPFPPDSLPLQPEQENKLIDEERAGRLAKALSRLTDRERRLFRLLCSDELSACEIAKEMRIKPESVYRERVTLIKKIGKMVRSENEE
jgi:RNA polymerase sigma factor (sigma-70 family)